MDKPQPDNRSGMPYWIVVFSLGWGWEVVCNVPAADRSDAVQYAVKRMESEKPELFALNPKIKECSAQ